MIPLIKTFPLLTMIPSEGEQWGCYNLPRWIMLKYVINIQETPKINSLVEAILMYFMYLYILFGSVWIVSAQICPNPTSGAPCRQMFGRLVCHVDLLGRWATPIAIGWMLQVSHYHPLSSLSKYLPTLSGAQTCCVKMSCSDMTIAKGLGMSGCNGQVFSAFPSACGDTLCARSLSLILRFWSQVLTQDLRTTLPRPCWRFKMPRRLLQHRQKLLQHFSGQQFGGSCGHTAKHATQVRNQLVILWQRRLACRFCDAPASQVSRQLLRFQLLQHDVRSLKMGHGSGEMFGASQWLFGTLDITACTLRGHGWGTHWPLESGGGPGCHFPPVWFVCFHA